MGLADCPGMTTANQCGQTFRSGPRTIHAQLDDEHLNNASAPVRGR